MTPQEQLSVGVHIETETLADQGDAETSESKYNAEPIDPGAPKQLVLDQLAKPAAAPTADSLTVTFDNTSDAPACGICGAIMVRSASCYKCMNCGTTSGCS
jgi:ribonucleoside-diphosphate reductase alpha chain